MYFNTIGGGSSRYKIEKSLRLRRAASARLSRTFTGSGYTTATISTWVKRSALDSHQTIVHSYASANDFFSVHFTAANQLYIYEDNNATDYGYLFNDIFRDPSAHFHLVVTLDSTNATAADRFRCYINGVRLTSINTNYGDIPLNYVFRMFNSTFSNYIGYNQDQNTYFDGYISEFNFVDGLALDGSAFGEFDSITGQWVARKYSGAYGTNGFYLDFKDNSNLTNLCLDKSGNGNHWTATNVSLTAGSTYDSMLDTPTNNYATVNQLTPLIYAGGYVSDGSLLSVSGYSNAYNCYPLSTIYVPVGTKFYAEFTLVNNVYPATTSVGCSGAVWVASGTSSPAGISTTYGGGDIIGVGVDRVNNVAKFYKNGTFVSDLAISATNDITFVADGMGNAGYTIWRHNYGQHMQASGVFYQDALGYFQYAPPTGFKALCTQNLPAPSIENPKKHFDVITWAGTNGAAAKVVSGLSMAPDLVWGKIRSLVGSHTLFDSVRGVAKTLRSNTTDPEVSNEPGGYVSSFNSDGFTASPGSADNWYWNSSGSSYVSWLWKAGGAAVSNTSGTITSQVSANTTAGFSIVTYTGTGANATVGHGLGVAPKLVIVKARGTPNGNARDWPAWHGSFTATEYAFLNTTNAKSSASGSLYWNSNSPTSGVFSVGIDPSVNWNASTYVAYCFAEVSGYSKISSYIGNGSNDGPFVYCGFLPRFVMIKRIDVAGDWSIYDDGRNVSNVMSNILFPNLGNAETGGYAMDFVASGFKLRYAAASNANASGGTYIFYAVAEAPFQFANAR